jgi:hypothetical protein
MATLPKSEGKVRCFGENIESDLASRFLRVVEVAAIASAHTMGQGERKLSDQVATEAMRKVMDSIPMRGTIVIGEGERDEAPMLYIGEKVGAAFPNGIEVPEVDIAVDPLEGTNLCATGAPGAITVLAASERGGLLNAPDCYMDKIVVGPSCKNAVELDAPVADNLKNIAKRLGRDVEDLVVIVLDRPRHEKLIAVPPARASGSSATEIFPLASPQPSSVPACTRLWARAARRKVSSPPPPSAASTAICRGGLSLTSPNSRNASRRWASRTRSASTKLKTWLPASNSSLLPPA